MRPPAQSRGLRMNYSYKYYILLVLSFCILLISPFAVGGNPADQFLAKVRSVDIADERLADIRIDSVTLSSETIAWGCSRGVCVQTSDWKVRQWWDAKNTPMGRILELAPIAYYGSELWVANRDQLGSRGLLRYDGKKWHVYSLNDEMLSELVTTMLEDSKGRFWLGYEERGIDRYLGKEKNLRLFRAIKVKSVGEKKGMLGGAVTSLAWNGGYLWVGTAKGLCRIDPEADKKNAFKRWTYGTDFPAQMVTALAPYGDGSVIAATDFGLVFPNSEKWNLLGLDSGLMRGYVKSLVVEGDRIWIAGMRGLQCYENGKFSTVMNASNILPSDNVRCMAAKTLPDGTSQLFLGTEKGARIICVNR